MLHVFEQQQRRKLMHKHSRLATARPSRHHNTARLMVLDNLFLSRGQLPEKLAVFGWSKVAVYFFYAISLEVLAYELSIVHLKVVVHILQGSVIVANHQIGVFAYYMYLLNLLLVELVERVVVVLLITQAIVLQPANVHGIVEHKKSAFELQRPNLRQVEQRLLHILQLQVGGVEEQHLPIRLNVVKQFHYRELHRSCFLGLVVHGLRHTVKPVDNKPADVQAFFKALQS